LEDLYILKKFRIYSILGFFCTYSILRGCFETSKFQERELITIESKLSSCKLTKYSSEKFLDITLEGSNSLDHV